MAKYSGLDDMDNIPGSFRRVVLTRGETPPEQAMYRELYEEVGLTKKDVRILASSRHWLRYKLPKRLVRWDSKPVCIGQKQKWFLLSWNVMSQG